MTEDLHIHVGIQSALGNTVVNAHGNDIIANAEIFLNVDTRLRLPVVRFAGEVAVHKIPTCVLATAEADERSGALQVLFGHLDVRTINRRRVRRFDGRPAAADRFPGGVIKIICEFWHGAPALRNFSDLPAPFVHGNVVPNSVLVWLPAGSNRAVALRPEYCVWLKAL